MNNARRDAEWLAFNRPSTESYDSINPSHYKADREFEPIDVIEDWELNYHLANALKYISRNGRKPGEDPREGLSKAIWYLERLHDKYTEEAAQKEDAEDLLESIRRQEDVEFHALGAIPSSVIFGSDEDALPYDLEGWEYPEFNQAAQVVNFPYGKDVLSFEPDEVIYQENDGANILGHKANGDVIWMGSNPSFNYEAMVKMTLEDDKFETDPWDQLPSDVNLDEMTPTEHDRYIFEFDR